MKIGDKVRRKGIVGEATVVSSDVKTYWDSVKQKQIVKTTYMTIYDNGSWINFHGYDIGRTIFKSYGEQISMFDYIKEEGL